MKQLCSFPAMLVVVFAGILFLIVPRSIADPDITWHLRNAETLIHTHAFVRQDFYSFTLRGTSWVNPEWLSEIPFYLGWRWFGARGVYLVTAAAIETILLGIFGLAYLLSKNAKAAFVVSFLAIFLADVSFGPRTLLFGWIMLIAELAILYRFYECTERGSETAEKPAADSIWLLPPLFLIWVNLHGSWMIGFVLLGLFIVCGSVQGSWGLIEAKRWTRPEWRRLAIASGLSVAALFCNPYGWRTVFYPFDMAFQQKLNIANVDEWRSLDFHTPRGKIVLGLMAATIVLQLARRRKWMLHEIAFLLLGVYSALTYSRFLFLAAILIFPMLAKDLAQWMPFHADRDKPWLNAPIMLAFVVAAGMMFPKEKRLQEGWSKDYPQEALTYLHQFHPNGNLFNQYEWGGFLIWNVRQVPVLMDSRVDIFEHHGILADYLDAVRMKNSLEILDKYSIRYVLVRTKEPLSYLLTHTGGWKTDYQDKTAILLERIGSMPSAVQNARKPVGGKF